MFPVAISLKLFMPSTLHFSCLFRFKFKFTNSAQVTYKSTDQHTNKQNPWAMN